MALSRRTFVAGLALAAGGSALGGYALSRRAIRHGAPAGAAYTCSMHPQIRQSGPGTCPICNMNLVRLEAGAPGAAAGQPSVHVAPDVQQRMGLETAAVSSGPLARSIRAYAGISADDSAAVSVNPTVEGWLRRLAVRGVGDRVRRGQVLYEIYSPELQQRQREYIELLVRKDGLLSDSSMTVAASNAMMAGSLAKEKFRTRARLIAAGMDESLVEQLERGRRVIEVVPVRAERDGVVTAVGARAGSFVNPMQQILAYADNRQAWAELTLFPDQLAWIRNGDTVTLRSTIDRQAVVRARLDLATLQVDPASRTARLRLPLSGQGAAFPPGVHAEALIEADRQHVLHVPREAVVRTGAGDYVLLAQPDHHFRRVPVETGIESEDAVAVRGALRAGDRVAVRAQFLLDGALARQAEAAPPPAAPAVPTPHARHGAPAGHDGHEAHGGHAGHGAGMP